MNKHIIKGQEFQIEIGDKKDAHKIQSSISALQSTRINALIDSILDSFDDPDCVFSFDNVELDLGTVSKYNYENEIIFKIEEALTNFFNNAITRNGVMRLGRKISREVQAIDSLEHYLLKGYFDWNMNITRSPSSLLHKIVRKDKTQLISLLKRIAGKEEVRKRIVYNFKEEDLETIVIVAAGSHGEYILNHKHNIIKTQEDEHIVNATSGDFNKAIWEIIMAYLFAEGRSYFSKKSYLDYLIRKLARRYNLHYTDLLSSLSEGIKHKITKFGREEEFVKIITELSRETQIGEDANQTRHDTGHVETTEFLKQVDHYLQHGVFSTSFKQISKYELNLKIKELIRNGNPLLLDRIDSWLSVRTNRVRILTILDSQNQLAFIERSKLPLVQSGLAFVRVLLSPTIASLNEAKDMLRVLDHRKGALILDVTLSRNFTEASLYHQILHNLFKYSSNNEHTMFRFLFDSCEGLSGNQKKAVEKFLVNFYQNMGNIAFDEIAMEIKNFCKSNPRQKWLPWYEYQLVRWTKITGLSKTTLSHYLNARLKKEGAPYWILDLINLEKETLRDRRITSKVNSQPDLDTIIYIMKFGHIPWWNSIYSYDDFNTDIQVLLSKTSGRSIIKRMLQNPSVSYKFLEVLNPKAEEELWKALDVSSGHSNFRLALHLRRELEANFVLSGLMKASEFLSLRKTILNLFVKNEGSRFSAELIGYLETWSSITTIIKYPSASEKCVLILSSMFGFISNQQTSVQLKRLIEAINIHDLEITNKIVGPKKLSEILAKFQIALPYSNYGIMEQLLDNNDVAFDSLLMKSDFRTALLSELTSEEVWKVITTQLGHRHQREFDQATTYLRQIQSILSEQAYRALCRSFSNIVLFKLTNTGFSTWQTKDWVRLLYEILQHQLGVSKADKTIYQINTRYAEGVPIFNILLQEETEKSAYPTPLPENDPEVRIDYEDENYRKLGEESKYQLMNPVFTNYTGLIILSPYLGILFQKCGLMEEGSFRNKESRARAVQLLDYAATADTNSQEHELLIPKVLCGIPVSEPIDVSYQLSEEHKLIVDDLLLAVTRQWRGMENTSITALRESFLQRDGKLEELDEHFYIKVEQRSYDVLLDRIPWNITKIKLSWMDKLIEVEWR